MEESMPHHPEQNSLPATRLLRLFIRLLRDGRKHYLTDLKRYLACSPQTVLRMTDSIAAVMGGNFTTGIENNRRWFRMNPKAANLSLPEGCGAMPRIALTDILDIETDALSYAAHAGHISAFLKAAEERRFCRIALVPDETALFLPVRLLFRDGLLYFAGWRFASAADSRPAAASLPVHLVSSVTPGAKAPAGNAAESRLLLPQFPPDGSYPVRVRLDREYAERVLQDLVPGYAVERCADGGIILNMKEGSTPFRAWLRSFGRGARVLGRVKQGRAGLPGAASTGRFDRKH